MKRVVESANWPESWKLSYAYDRMEIYGEEASSGYAYAYRERQKHILECVTRLLPGGARILDVAAAQGNFTLLLAELGYRVTWNDLRSDLAGYVRAKHEYGHVEYLPGNVLDLGASEPFDAILLAEIIEHVAHPDRFLRKISEFVRSDGWIILTTPNGGYLRNRLPRFSDCEVPEQYESVQFRPNADGHIFLLHDDEIIRLSRIAGLAVHDLRHYCNPLTNGHMKLAGPLRVIPQTWVEWFERATLNLPASFVRRLHAGTIAALRRVQG